MAIKNIFGKNKKPEKGSDKVYPAIALRETVVFPGEKAPMMINGVEPVRTVNEALNKGGEVVLIFKDNGEESKIGVTAKILQYWFLSRTAMGMTIEGTRRALIKNKLEKGEVSYAEVSEISSGKPESDDVINLEALARSVFDQFRKMMQMEGVISLAVVGELQKGYADPERTADIVASSLSLNFQEKLELLEELDIKKRLEILNSRLAKEINIIKTERKIRGEVEKEMGKAQKEFLLREQLKAIEKELGLGEESKEYDELEKKIKEAKLTKEAEDRALKELYRLKRMSSAGAEAPYIRAYLDWIIELPWSKKSEVVFDIKKAQVVLDEDHYGLVKAKERVLEYLAVQKLTEGKSRGNILCFVGPPGTGKTSVGRSIARALGRSFVRISLGGVRDEAEIRGHRRTYVGALPGRILQGMKTAGTKNPVFMLDEIDKLGADFRGDPSSALLEVLDPEQNNAFSDHYLEMPYDLSEVFFITTANLLDPIPPALRDRMEVIEFPGYTEDEKFHIAKKFVIPKVFSGHGLSTDKLLIEDRALYEIISKYTREAGVRNLERKIAEIARKTAKKMAENKVDKQTKITPANLADFIGPEIYEITMKEEKDEVGIATGLAWTPMGGEIMFVEVTVVPGKGNLTLTGQLGDVMQESAKAALSYIRSRCAELKIDPEFFYKNDIHIHVPSGAIPKDGPSAGIAIATALASALTKRRVKKEVALTGEVTLSGKVLEIGGVKEKVLAAHSAGVETVALPKSNEKNLVDIPEESRNELKLKFVGHMDEVLKLMLLD
ncbi:MAG: endopeptidase La [Candidatus Pacebacteria bacterium]|nr:endopeptidase La [Candidatus Paceibacterota bacterium]NUQ57293.1 endopeptidase La [Candidatus Paceibacter sp.]